MSNPTEGEGVSEIKIVSRWDRQKVLYVAEGASGIKKALEAARDNRANLVGANLQDANLQDADLQDANLQDADLQDANLQDANLWDANLRGANLQGANLRGANLRDANLWDANLWGADLRGANLRGANLRGADLRGANLRGANLRGADLGGADLGAEVWSEVVDILTRALSEISITGHWIKGSLSKQLESGEQAYCAIGAVREKGEGTALAVASWLLASVAGGSVEDFNDAKATKFSDVKAVFKVAIIHAKRWANQ